MSVLGEKQTVTRKQKQKSHIQPSSQLQVLPSPTQQSQRVTHCLVGSIRGEYMEHTCTDHIDLDSFHVSEEYGFLLEKPAVKHAF